MTTRTIFLIIVFLCSFVGAWLLPADEFFKGIFSTPAVLALIGVLYQVIRDEAAHEKRLEIQQQQQLFNLGATSHMANVAFDKHVQFCEQYMIEVHETVSTLFKEGPSDKALQHASKFVSIRQEFAAWVTEDINERLFPFEQALRELGAGKGFMTDTIGLPEYAEQRKLKVKEVWDKFNSILTIQGDQPDEHVAVEAVKGKVRGILDIEDLIHLRKGLISNARASLGKHYKFSKQNSR